MTQRIQTTHRSLRWILMLVGLTLLSGVVHSQGLDDTNVPEEPVRTGWTFSFENDLFVGDDSRYTNGLAIYYGKGVFKHFTPNNIPRLLHRLIGRTYINQDKDRERAIVYGFFQAMQTPENIVTSELQLDDVPYAGLLGAEVQLFSFSDTITDRMTLTLGFVGPLSLAREAQKGVHAIVGADNPRGWRHQIRNEPVAMLELQKGIRLLYTDQRRAVEADLVVLGSGALGNLRSDLSTTVVARIGQKLITSFPTVSVAPNRQVNPTAFTESSSWDAFVGVRAAYVANEIGTDGNTFAQSHSVPLDHTEIQVSVGVGWNLERWAFNLIISDFAGSASTDPFGSFSITRRTR